MSRKGKLARWCKQYERFSLELPSFTVSFVAGTSNTARVGWMEGCIDRVFSVRSRGGQVVRIAREHYLRSDIACGVRHCKQCYPQAVRAAAAAGDGEEAAAEHEAGAPLSLDAAHYVVVDYDVALHYMDLLDFEAAGDSRGSQLPFENVIFPETGGAGVRRYRACAHCSVQS